MSGDTENLVYQLEVPRKRNRAAVNSTLQHERLPLEAVQRKVCRIYGFANSRTIDERKRAKNPAFRILVPLADLSYLLLGQVQLQ